MPLKIIVPLNRVQQAVNSDLVLDHPQRCSRCGAIPAERFENHNLALRIGRKRRGLYRQRYRVSQPYRLKLRLCETCYRIDFVTSMEELEKDNTAQGRLARLYHRVYTFGAIIAGAGLLLMTSLIPENSVLGGIKLYWPYIIGIGGFIIMAVWLHQRSSMRKAMEELESHGIALESRPRAEVRTPVLDDENDPLAVPLEIHIHDETWAAECAAYFNLETIEYTPGVFKGEE